MVEICSAVFEKPPSPHLLSGKGNFQLSHLSCFVKGAREECASEIEYNTPSKAWSPAPAQGLLVFSVYDILISAHTTQSLVWPKSFLKTEFGSQSHSQTFRTFICLNCFYFLGILVQKCAQLQFLYFYSAIFVPFLHYIKQFLWQLPVHYHQQSAQIYANCFYPSKFTSLTIDGQNLLLKTIPTLSLVQSILILNKVCLMQLGAHPKPSKILTYSEDS